MRGSAAAGAADGRRVPFDETVQVKYRLFQDFVREASGNLSRGGMFLRTRNPREPGEEFEFEIRLEDLSLVAGRGRVAWVRRSEQGPERPVGMGVKFLELFGDSEKIVGRVVEERTKSGGAVFDLEREAPITEERPEPPPAPPPSSKDPVAPPPPRAELEVPLTPLPPPLEAPRQGGRWLRTALLILTSAFAGGLVVLGVQWLFIRPQLDELARQVDELSFEAVAGARDGLVAAQAAPGEAPAVSLPGAAAAGEPGPAASEAPGVAAGSGWEAEEAVRSWARAWSEQRFADYLAHYSREFAPAGGLDRDAWEEQRRERIVRPGGIRVGVTALTIEDVAEGRKTARFVQSYRAGHYSDLVRKRLDLAWEDEAWKIAGETVER